MPPFIVIEGIDGSGKGTQARLLIERFKERGYDPFLTSEPTKGPIGKLIREHMANPFLDDRTLALLFASDRIEHLEKEIRPALEAMRPVISDRYVFSSMAYQGQTLDMEWLGKINDHADRPDLVILLDVPPDLSRRRLEDREREFEYFEIDEGFQDGVRKSFVELSRGHHTPPSLKTEWCVIDASKGKEEVFEKAWDMVERLLSK